MQNRMGSIVLKSAILVGISIIFSLIFNLISPNSISWFTKIHTVSVRGNILKIPIYIRNGVERDFVSHSAEDIALEMVYELHNNHSAIFLDARSYSDYKAGHLKDALSVPYDAFTLIDSLADGLDLDQKIVTYCDDIECSVSIDLAVYLEEMGFLDVYFFMGGWQEWLDAGYPVSVGDKP